MNLDKVTRVVYIYNKREFDHKIPKGEHLEFQLQDDGKTLKVFQVKDEPKENNNEQL